jgi:hypothetical protein
MARSPVSRSVIRTPITSNVKNGIITSAFSLILIFTHQNINPFFADWKTGTLGKVFLQHNMDVFSDKHPMGVSFNSLKFMTKEEDLGINFAMTRSRSVASTEMSFWSIFHLSSSLKSISSEGKTVLQKKDGFQHG